MNYMASKVPTTQVNGIDLANYYPSTRSYNSVVYIHKKFLNTVPPEDPKESAPVPLVPATNENIYDPEPKVKERKKKSVNKVKRKLKADTIKDTEQTSVNNDEVLGQTIRFAKNIVPIVIPPNQDTSPVYYTIKTSRKSRRISNKPRDSTLTHDLTYEKQKQKKVVETYRKEKYKSHTESFSRESVSRSSKSSIIENLIINQSLNCSLSEISDKRQKKDNAEKISIKHRFVSSESFEALATELLDSSGDAKIKIHLMNDSAKDLLYESIRNPIIEAIKDSISELVHRKNNDSATVQRYVQCHTQKLDNILDKLECIEKRLTTIEQKPKIRSVRDVKASALEEIGEDIAEKEKSSSDEDTSNVYSICERQKARCTSAVTKLNPLQKQVEKDFGLGGGEDGGDHKSVTPAIPSDRARIPARYCWTDSTNQ